MVEAHPLILSLRSAGLKDLDPSNVDEVHSMWYAFSKAKHSIDGGDRLEYSSWRLYSREILRQHAYQRPKFADVSSSEASDMCSSEESELSQASENDSESASESDLTSDDINTSLKSHLEPENPLVDHQKKPSNHDRVKFDVRASKPAKGISQRRKNNLTRPISSLELQQLFDEVQGQPKKHLEEDFRPSSGVEDMAKQSQAAKLAFMRNSKYPNNILKTRLGTPLENDDSSHNSLESESSVVRGFSPSSISVTKFQNPRQQPSSISITHKLQIEAKSEKRVNEKGESHHEELQPKKIFYLGEIDSDIDSSTNGSLNTSTKVGNAKLNEPEDNNSDWDDISDDDTAAEDEQAEKRRREMFKERPVPTKPLLKRSLLSSLFVNQYKNVDKTQPAPDKNRDEVGTPKGKQKIAAPVDILLGAPLAPHFPFIGPTGRKNSTSSTESSSSLSKSSAMPQDIRGFSSRPNYRRASVSADNKLLAPTDTVSPRMTESFGEASTHMTARPEIYRASTDLHAHKSSTMDERFQQSWAHQHEDIYDPLNYHSRGW